MANEGLLSPVPEFHPVRDDNRNDSEKQLPEFDEQDYISHRNVYVGVHVPYSVPRNRKHHHKKKSKRKKLHVQEGGITGRTTPLLEVVDHIEPPKTPVDPCDRVKFILGEESTDGAQHTAHSIFTELEELHYDEQGQRLEWKETARWVKFEEDLEERGEKWSKPHVASLSLHSLFDLRSCMLKGTVMLDLVANNLEEISDNVLDHLISSKQLEEEQREKVHAALLQRHKHHCTKDTEKRRFSRIKNLGDIVHRDSSASSYERQGSVQSASSFLSWFGYHGNSDSRNGGMPRRSSSNGSAGNHQLNVSDRQNSNTGSEREEEHHHYQFDQHFMKKLPEGSEASNVLVGEVGFLKNSIIAFVRLSEAVFLGDLTEVPIPTRFLFILLGPEGNHDRYHEIGRAIATMMSDEVFHEVAYKARNREDLLAGIDEFLDKVTVLPPGEWDPQIRLEPPAQLPSQAQRLKKNSSDTEEAKPPPPHPVKFSKIPLSGVWSDLKRRYSMYHTDFKDAVWDSSSNKCSVLTLLSTIATVVFIYFANISPAITFGQVLSEKTRGNLGAVEMILSVGIGNFLFALTAGQPMVVLGGTGPTLIFEDILFRFCDDNDLPYLEFRLWIGLWTALMLTTLVVFNASAIVRIFTRFTEEIFSSLISFIFIYEAIDKIWKIHVVDPYSGYYWFPFWSRKCDCYQFSSSDAASVYEETNRLVNATNLGSFWDYHDNNSFIELCDTDPLRVWSGNDCPGEVVPDVFFFSIILFVGTFLVAIYLKKFKESPFFPSTVRRIISDFAVLISVIIWIIVNYFANVENVPTLEVPNLLEQGLYTTENATRTSILISPLGNGLPHWAPVAAVIPAMLATILLFMDQQITALIVNRKDHKLKKGPGYHLDLLIVAFLVGLFSILGLPWVVGATVRSIAHVQSLFIYSPCTAPGERPKFLGVKEQRVTLLCMSVLLGISVLMYQVLELVPLAVLYGLFLYIGVTSLYGVQFVQRILIIFMPDKYKPDEQYIRHIPNRRLHLYTLVQIIMLAILCVFKVVTQISIIFPIMVLLLVAGRWLVGWIFPAKDLEILDDPIPEKLYCGRGDCTPSKMKGRGSGGCGNGCGCGDELDAERGLEMKEDLDAKYLEENDRKCSGDASINMTKELNNCDLWKHMVCTMDREPHSLSLKQSQVKSNLLSKFQEAERGEIASAEGAESTSYQPLFKSTEV